MCLSCTITELTGVDLSLGEGHEALAEIKKANGGRIPWPPVTKEMRQAAKLIAALHEMPAGGVGGPIHIVTDDTNVEDDHLSYCRGYIDEWWGHKDYSEYEAGKVVTICGWILDLLEPMDTKQRSVTVSLANGYIDEIHGRVYMPATEFPIREDTLDAEGNRVGWQWGFRSRRVDSDLGPSR